jgi:hypothetical protein
MPVASEQLDAGSVDELQFGEVEDEPVRREPVPLRTGAGAPQLIHPRTRYLAVEFQDHSGVPF